MAMLACDRRDAKRRSEPGRDLSARLVFLSLELTEFAHMVSDGAGPSRSAFLSAFFTLVGTHGLHVTAGLVWLVSSSCSCAARASAKAWCGGCSASACSGT
jgi:heme/copper-type cytochrome/quinol oxidase subunit 3